MEKIILRLRLQQHKGTERIFAHYPYHTPINQILKEIPALNTAILTKAGICPTVKEIAQMLAEKVKDVAEGILPLEGAPVRGFAAMTL